MFHFSREHWIKQSTKGEGKDKEPVLICEGGYFKQARHITYVISLRRLSFWIDYNHRVSSVRPPSVAPVYTSQSLNTDLKSQQEPNSAKPQQGQSGTIFKNCFLYVLISDHKKICLYILGIRLRWATHLNLKNPLWNKIHCETKGNTSTDRPPCRGLSPCSSVERHFLVMVCVKSCDGGRSELCQFQWCWCSPCNPLPEFGYLSRPWINSYIVGSCDVSNRMWLWLNCIRSFMHHLQQRPCSK